MELNPRIKLFIIIGIILLLLTGIPFKIGKEILFPQKQVINTTPEIIIYRNITTVVTVTPTPDGKIYFAGEYESGIRLLAHPFSWYRANVNFPEQKLKISANVYDYRIFDTYHYKDFEYSDSPNNIYEEQIPNNPNDEFIFVMADIYDDSTITNTPNIWLPSQNNYAISINGITYTPIIPTEPMQIKEMEEITTQQNDFYIQPFGTYHQYDNTNTHNELYNNGTVEGYEEDGVAGNNLYTLSEIPKGASNMVDGYLLFEIPKDTPISAIEVMGNFASFGYSSWKLNKEVIT